jgi:hypothetical protein
MFPPPSAAGRPVPAGRSSGSRLATLGIRLARVLKRNHPVTQPVERKRFIGWMRERDSGRVATRVARGPPKPTRPSTTGRRRGDWSQRRGTLKAPLESVAYRTDVAGDAVDAVAPSPSTRQPVATLPRTGGRTTGRPVTMEAVGSRPTTACISENPSTDTVPVSWCIATRQAMAVTAPRQQI